MKTAKTHWSDILVKAGACSEGLEYARKFSSFQECWDACENPEWLFWWIGKCIGNSRNSRKALVRCSCEMAQFVLPIFEKEYPKDRRPRKAIKTALAWTEGKASLEEVRKAARAANAACDAANAAYYAAYYAANAAYCAARSARSARAANAAYCAAYYADRASKNPQKILEIIRKHYPVPPEYK